MTHFDNINPDNDESFAWCFSHGRLHRFNSQPWCTADWVRLPGASQDEARAAQVERFGEAVFLHHLPLEQQAEIVQESSR